MPSKLLIASLAAFASLAVAQNATITVNAYAFDDGTNYTASVAAAKPEATTFILDCDDDSDGPCDSNGAITLIIGPNTQSLAVSVADIGIATLDCKFTSMKGTCQASVGGSMASFPTSTSTTLEPSDFTQLTIVVTAGADKLAATSGSGSSSKSTSGPAATQSSAKTGASISQSTGPAKTGAAPTQRTGNAASTNAVMLGGGFFGVAAGLLGAFL